MVANPSMDILLLWKTKAKLTVTNVASLITPIVMATLVMRITSVSVNVMKKCPTCEIERPLDEFHKNKSRSDGRQCICKHCRVNYSKEHYNKDKKPYLTRSHNRRVAYRIEVRGWLWELKSQPCTDCGRKHHPCQVDFDHVRGKKEFDISRAASAQYSRESIEVELEKCEVVCSNCHRLRTYKRMRSGEN